MRYYIAALIIIVLYTGIASAFSPADMEWAAAVSGTLSKGSTLTNGQYMVKAVQFPSAVTGINDINGNIVPETPEPTPTPITPGFDIAFAVVVLIFMAAIKRR